MGMILSEPETNKRSYGVTTTKYMIGSSAMQGWRTKMEDAHTIIVSPPEEPQTSFFGVFDGHGGSSVSNFASRNLYSFVTREASYLTGQIKEGIEKAFMELDSSMMHNEHVLDETSGSTAIVIIIRGETLYAANTGDSRAVAFAQGKAHALSVDHKPNLTQERRRIIAAGGYILYNRVNGNLALSRAFGDSVYKKNRGRSMREQVVTCFPDVIEKALDNSWEFLVLACDGIWEVMTNEQVCKFVKNRIAQNMRPADICEELMSECLCKEPTGYDSVGLDNMTVIIVVFLGCASKPYNTLQDETVVTSVNYVCNAPD